MLRVKGASDETTVVTGNERRMDRTRVGWKRVEEKEKGLTME